MKRKGIIINADFKKIGKGLASWGCSGMNWAAYEARDELVSLAKKIRSSAPLCEALGRAYRIHCDAYDWFNTQSGVTALIFAINGDHNRRIAMIQAISMKATSASPEHHECRTMKKQRFHLSDVLSMITGKLLSVSGMDGIYRIAEHLAGEPVWTHQLGRFITESRQHLLNQFPDLATVTAEGVAEENLGAWLNGLVAEHGEWLDVAQMPGGAHEAIDPISEAAEKTHPDRILIL